MSNNINYELLENTMDDVSLDSNDFKIPENTRDKNSMGCVFWIKAFFRYLFSKCSKPKYYTMTQE